ncbi:MAG: isopeptide-forming domain-containing fimbrial protein [Clostridiales bacterium]|nr:isopeptide-forming domain-containing fimbrial protein [Clostridiales bacterium]
MIKGKLKQKISILLIAVMALLMTAPGFAATGHTLTIKSQTAGHTFELYQIFKGDVATDSDVLTNIKWGDSVENPSKLIEALKSDNDLKGFFDEVDTTASEDAQAVAVAAGLSATLAESTASALADKFAELVEDYLSTTPYKSVTGGDTTYTYQFTDVEDGYYLVKDKDESLDLSEYGKDTAAYTKYIIGVIGEDKNIDAKADKPDIEKYIENPHTDDPNDTHDDLEKTEEYSIGDDIIYHLKSEVPKMDGYDHYWFMVQDELSAGLTFVGMATDGAAVTVGGEEVNPGSAGEDWTYTFTQDGQKLYFVFNNFLESYKESYVGKEIVIRYIVRLNENAKIGAEGNDNTVSLVYSNNPYVDYSGKEPTPGGDNPGTGQTSDKKTVT